MRKTLKETPYYEIDEHGNIYSKFKGKKLTGESAQLNLKISEDSHHTFYRKAVIANNLIENPENHKYVVQIDGDTENYHPSNLMWAETVYGNPIFDKKTDKYIRNKMNVIIRNCYGRIKKGKQYSAHKHYGAKGIKVCDEWHDTLEFLKWSKKNGYFEGAWLYRFDKLKDYGPDNCYWGQPNVMKLNCEMAENIKQMELPNKTIANKYSITSERVRQIKKGSKLKACE